MAENNFSLQKTLTMLLDEKKIGRASCRERV